MPAKPRVFRNIASGNRIKKRKNEQQGQNGIDFVGQPRAALHQQKEDYDDGGEYDDAQSEAADVFQELVHTRLGSNETKLSDGHRERVARREEVLVMQNVSAKRVAVRSSALVRSSVDDSFAFTCL